MDVGDKIKIFPDTDVDPYVIMLRDAGFNCSVKKGQYILITSRYTLGIEDRKAIGRSITAARRAANKTRKELAEMMGLKNPQTVYNWEIGAKVPNNENKAKLRDLIGWKVVIK